MALQEAQFRGREDALKRRDIELQDSLIRFSKFLQDNDAKRVRALKKAADERRIREEKERELVETVRPTKSSDGATLCQRPVPHIQPWTSLMPLDLCTVYR